MRDFEYDERTAGTAAERLAKAKVDAMVTLGQVKRQCLRKFSDVFSVWIHVKAVRVFVESVLRFGLPVNFVCALIKVCATILWRWHSFYALCVPDIAFLFQPRPGSEEKLHEQLSVRPELMVWLARARMCVPV